MRVLVIGGAGFIGRPLQRELVDGGHEVAVLRRSAATQSDGEAARGVLLIQGDRNRLEDCTAEIRKFSPQVIIDMILSSAQQAEQEVRLAREIQARLVAISSMDVYRAWGVLLGTEPGELEPMPITEDSAVRSVNRAYPPEVVQTLKQIFTWLTTDYDKVSVEQQVMRGGEANTVVRLPMVYGEGDPLHRMYGVVKRAEDGRRAILLPQDQAHWRGPRGFVDNVAHAIILAASSERSAGRTYHVCEEPSVTDLEWMKTISETMEWDGRFVVLPVEKTPKHLLLPGNKAQQVVADSSRIRRELGYREVVTIPDAMKRTVAWERANPPSGPSFHQFDYEAEDAALHAE